MPFALQLYPYYNREYKVWMFADWPDVYCQMKYIKPEN